MTVKGADTTVAFRGWIEFQDKNRKSVDPDKSEFKYMVARIAIGSWFCEERLPLHLLKMSEEKQSAYLDVVNKRLTQKISLALRRKGIEIKAMHSEKTAAEQIQSLVTKEKPKDVFTYKEA